VGVDRERKKGLDSVLGERSQETGRGLYERLRRHEVEQFYTEFWQAYRAILPRCSHKDSKAERHGVERVHSLMRPYLARFCRRSRCFSRSVERMV
jgi:insertion element IS1 protein InsB